MILCMTRRLATASSSRSHLSRPRSFCVQACLTAVAADSQCSSEAAAAYYAETNVCGGKEKAGNAFCSKCDVGNQKAFCCTCDPNCPEKDNMCGRKTCVPGSNRVACKHCDVKDAPPTREIEAGDGTVFQTERACSYELIVRGANVLCSE